MHLYLVQHGEAKGEEEDPERGLTEKGVEDVDRIAQWAAGVQVKPVTIHHSGKARARHTALILADFLRPPEGIRGSGGLGPTDNPEVWYKLLAGMEEDVMLVGHLPHLSRLTGMLLAKDKEEAIVDFKMGGMVCLKRVHSERWQIEWMIIPELIRG